MVVSDPSRSFLLAVHEFVVVGRIQAAWRIAVLRLWYPETACVKDRTCEGSLVNCPGPQWHWGICLCLGGVAQTQSK